VTHPDGDIYVDFEASQAYGAVMVRRIEMGQPGKWKSRFYLCCAAILFALGVWLLIAPAKAHGQSLRDNGFALRADGLRA
jgi:hypothetical protein